MEVATQQPQTSRPRRSKGVAAPKPETPPAAPAAPVKDDDAAFLAIIAAMAGRENVSGDQIERLFQAHERMKADKARRAYDLDLIELQNELPVLDENGTGEKGNSYLLLEDLLERVRPILHRHGFAITHRIASTLDAAQVTAVLTHRAGHREENRITLPHDTSDGKNAPQAVSSSCTYGRRITAVSILGIASRGADDDAKRADSQEPETITGEQVIEFLKLTTEAGLSGDALETLLKKIKAPDVKGILAKDFAAAKADVRAYKLHKAKKQEAAQ